MREFGHLPAVLTEYDLIVIRWYKTMKTIYKNSHHKPMAQHTVWSSNQYNIWSEGVIRHLYTTLGYTKQYGAQMYELYILLYQ